MRNAGKNTIVSAAFFAAAVLGLAFAASALAAIGPHWKLDTFSNTTAEPGSTFEYRFEFNNDGDAPMDAGFPTTVSASLPPGITVVSAGVFQGNQPIAPCKGMDGASPVTGQSQIKCTYATALPRTLSHNLTITAAVGEGATGLLIAEFQIAGGGAPAAATVDPIQIGPPPPFGVDAFDLEIAADSAGTPSIQAGAHPYDITTFLDFNTTRNPEPLLGERWPVEPVKDILVELPPGFVGSPAGVGQCLLSELANTNENGGTSLPLCSAASQVGVLDVRFRGGDQNAYGPVPLYNIVPPPNVPARFGFLFEGVVVVLDATLRSDGDYGLTVGSSYVSEALAITGTKITFWGDPTDESHRLQRACPGMGGTRNQGPNCSAEGAPATAFLRNPTACTGAGPGLETKLHVDSWTQPGAFTTAGSPDLNDPRWKSRSTVPHVSPGYPYPPHLWGPEVGIDGCEQVPFTPAIAAAPTTEAADSPSGLTVDLSIPQECWDDIEDICQSDLREAAVTLPAGMSVNPASASGLGACSPAQAGLTTPVGAVPARFTSAPVSCPESSKIGEVAIDTPLLEEELKGAVYLAKQNDNPFDSLLAMYLVAEGSGVVIKQAGEIKVGPDGRLATVFRETPQLPFSNLRMELYGGPRAVLRTPPSCGTYDTEATLTPWSGNPAVEVSSSFAITRGPGGGCPTGAFDPRLHAGSQNSLGGAFSPFVLRVTRDDGTGELTGIEATMPPGLLAKLAGIPYCPEAALGSVSGAQGTGAAQLASPACPAAAQVGRVTVGAGAGPSPFYSETGKVYLAGPYKGAPLSLAVVVPALAGPFDLGSVVVRNALHVNRRTARVTAASDPLPSVLHGIPLDLRDVRVLLDRPEFTLNPTSCDPMAVEATLTSLSGATARRSERYQVGACDRLGFKPALRLRLKGKTRRGGYPALRAVLRPRAGDANLARTSVLLPRSQFVAQNHLSSICTRVQFAADACPRKSVYGQARAFSPLLDQPLKGPVYLRSNGGARELPDLVAVLGGQIEIELVGYIDSVNRRLRARFVGVPDAPVSRFVLDMRGGDKGLLQNSVDLCARKQRASIKMDGQNGKVHDFASALRVNCGGKKGS